MATPIAGSLRPGDISWVTSLFGAPAMRDRRLRNQRLYSNAQTSFADTTVGGNQAINSPPQFTRFADPTVGGLFANPKNRSPANQETIWENENNVGSYALGAYYQESIEDNAFYIHCRFGKPKYLGTVAFFANMYDSNIAHLARTGDYPGILRTMGGYLGAAAIWAALGTVAFATVLIIPRVLSAVLNMDSSRYYYLKPTMHLYLRAVQNILNTQLLHYRIVPMSTLPMMKEQFKGITNPSNKYSGVAPEMYAQLPDIWKSSGEFDVYKMINRYQVLANYQARTFKQIYEEATDGEDLTARIEAFYTQARFTSQMREFGLKASPSLRELEYYHLQSAGYDAGIQDASQEDANVLNGLNSRYDTEFKSGAPVDPPAADDGVKLVGDENGNGAKTVGTLWDGMLDTVQDITGSIGESVQAELRDGGQWVTWKINGKDSVTHSFSNSTKEPEIASTINSMTSKARSLEVNTSGGKTGIEFADAAVAGMKGLFNSTLDTLHLTGLAALYNSSVIDFPEVWDSSDAGGNDFSFTIPLRCWSGNDLDVVQDIIMPMSFWIAAVCPIATGKQSYTHPFYLEAYARGRFSGRTCMVTSVSFNCGVGNMGWRSDGVPLGVDISVTIKDLSKAMYMPIVTDPSVWDTDNKFSDFMGVIGAQSLHEKVYGVDKAVFNFNKWKMSWKSAFSVGARTNQVMNTLPARLLAGITGGTAR